MRLHLLFSHQLLPAQIEDAHRSLGVDEIVVLSSQLIDSWSQIPPELESLESYLQPIFTYLSANVRPGEYVLVSGDLGASYQVAKFCYAIGLRPIYATTLRASLEEAQPDGSVQKRSQFDHVRFRAY